MKNASVPTFDDFLLEWLESLVSVRSLQVVRPRLRHKFVEFILNGFAGDSFFAV